MEGTAGDVANRARLERDDILHRKNAALLSADEVQALRAAFSKVKHISEQARGDDRGFFESAGQHGVPYWRCPHHTPQRLFLPWHRAYLYRLEQALQDAVPGVTLPWWDWTVTREIPAAFGAEGENPLGGSRTLVAEGDVRTGAPVIEETFRDPRPPAALPAPEALAATLAQPSYAVFNDACEGLHDAVHVWVGGTMANVGYAAFDPLFWAHHCMVDRVWWLWQQSNRMNAVPSAGWEGLVLEPFNLTIGDVLNANALGFDYADFETLLLPDPGRGGPDVVVTFPVEAADAVPATDFATAHLEIGGIRHTGSSWEGLVYLDNPDAGPDTGELASAGYVGTFHVFGHGGCFGAEGHCDAPDERRRFDNRPLSRAIRMKKRVDVTEPLRAAAAGGGQLSVTIVARASDGLPGVEAQGVLDFRRLSIVAYR